MSKQVCENFSSKKSIYWVAGRWATALFLFLTVLTPPAFSKGNYFCNRPLIPEINEVFSGPSGLWKPWHNTKKWVLKIVPGRDYMQHENNANRTIPVYCPSMLHLTTHGLHVDYSGNQDKCVWTTLERPTYVQNPTCKINNLTYKRFRGACLKNYNLPSAPTRQPSDYVVPFDDPSVCPGIGSSSYGGTLKFFPALPLETRNADKLENLSGKNISCPAGEKYSVQTKTTLQAPPGGAVGGLFVFNIPSHASKAYFSASVKPTAHVTPYLSELLGFAITDSEAGGSGHHWYYPTTGGPKDIGFTAYSLGNNVRNNAIFQDRWEVEVIPNFVHFGIPLNSINSSGSGSSTKIVAHFGKAMGPNRRTHVEKGKLEYCAEWKIIKKENIDHLKLPSPTQISKPPNTPDQPVLVKRNPICQRGETRFSVGSKTPKNWQARTVSRNGKSIVCAKFKQREIPNIDVPPIEIIDKKPDVERPYKKPVFKCRKGERLYESKRVIPRGWKWRSSVQHKKRVYCAFKPALPVLKCAKGEKKVRGQIKPPYGWLLLRKKRGKQVVWCLKRDRNARPPRCERGERLFTNVRKVPRGWHKRSIRQGRYTFYCAKRVQKACPKGYRAVGRKCIKDVIFKFPKPPRLIPGIPQKGQPSRDEPRQKKCPRGTRAYKGQCVKG